MVIAAGPADIVKSLAAPELEPWSMLAQVTSSLMVMVMELLQSSVTLEIVGGLLLKRVAVPPEPAAKSKVYPL
jgi:hypothetical protein